MDFYNNLKALIYQKGFKMKDISQKLALDTSSFTRKLKVGRFNVNEIKKLISILGKEVLNIFFVNENKEE